jgi:glycosyltransferase involved in cell wall biosynthesis
MRIAFVVRGGLHPSGRREVVPVLLALLERLAARHEVHAYTIQHLAEPNTYQLRGFTVHDLGRPGGTTRLARLSQWRALHAALASGEPYDVLHGFWVDPGGLLAALVGRRMGVPAVVTCSGGEFSALDDIAYGMQRTIPGRALVAAACRSATVVHVATHYMAHLAAQRGYKVSRIPIGTDIAALPQPTARSEGPPWKLLQVASLNRVKDQATLLDALAMAVREVDVHVDLVGEDTLDGLVQAHAARAGVAERVTFHGYLAFDELPSFFQAAHMYVQSSRHEASGAAVMEAAASGLPIVGTRVGYVADWDGERAVAADPGDAAALARAIVDTLRNRDLRARFAASARGFAETHDVAWTANQFEQMYESLITRTR